MNKVKYRVAGKTKTEKLTRAKAIKEFCVDCMNGQRNLVRECTSVLCPLYIYRTGKCDLPSGRKGRIMTEEHKQLMLDGKKKALKGK